MIDNNIIIHNNSILRWIAKEMNEGSFNGQWIKFRIDDNGKIKTLKKEEEIKNDKVVKKG